MKPRQKRKGYSWYGTRIISAKAQFFTASSAQPK